MKAIVLKTVKIAATLSITGLILAGCGAQTGVTTKSYDENFRFVPRIIAADNSFLGTSNTEFRGCTYDIRNEGYWCPINR